MDDKAFALLAATFAAVVAMAIVQFFGPDSPMRRRRREREVSEMYFEMWNRGRWFPPATREPPEVK